MCIVYGRVSKDVDIMLLHDHPYSIAVNDILLCSAVVYRTGAAQWFGCAVRHMDRLTDSIL